jgi:hypothetical protein
MIPLCVFFPFFLPSFLLPSASHGLFFLLDTFVLVCGLARAFQCTLLGDLRLRRSEFEMFKWDSVPVM